ncbi:MAG TPA: cytochrome c3 family protein, partial [Planctomycetota bacterium]|nr:cytochrome c3 family protein [Planctomycetota bacterium]HQB01472.1 cytochrome c3 family protein [Planctomycetota bacterium]
ALSMEQEIHKTIAIDINKCTKCGRCLTICKKFGNQFQCEKCLQTGIAYCQNECPHHAILFTEIKSENFQPISTIQQYAKDKTIRQSYKQYLPFLSIFFIIGIVFPSLAFYFAGEYIWRPNPLYNIHEGISCIECHTPFEGIASEKCGICHYEETYDIKSHPLPLTAISCTLCHTDHHIDPEGITSTKYMKNNEWCISCHENALFHKNVPPVQETHAVHTKPFILQNFNHELHFRLEYDLTCQRCHQELGDKNEKLLPVVKHETCLECHADYTVKDHGNWDLCHKCHEDDPQHDSPLQTLIRTPFSEPQIKKITWKGSDPISNPIDGELRFIHQRHLERTEEYEDCLFCHDQGIRKDTAQKLDIELVCTKCHTQGKEIQVQTEQTTRDALSFNHIHHLTNMEERAYRVLFYQKSCQACHILDNENFKTLPKEDTCRKCHLGHYNYGENYKELTLCVYCHYDIVRNTWSPQNQTIQRKYDNFSHSSQAQQHLYISCEDCHGNLRTNTKRATQTPLNIEYCNKCHENKEEKGTNCQECHNYHSMFLKD